MELLRLYLQIQSGNKINPFKSYLDTSWLYRCTGGDIPCKASTHKYLKYFKILIKKKKSINRTLLIISKLNDSSVSIKT